MKNQKITFVDEKEKPLPWKKTESMERVFDLQLLACYKSKIRLLATVDCYMGKSRDASVVHCFFRLNDERSDTYRYGYGSAGGGGYCKKSASMSHALDWAGLKLEKSINGVGESAMREALEAIAKKLNYRIYTVL